MKLLTTSNTKLLKSKELGYLSFGLHLAPHNLSGFNTCPSASLGCSKDCLNTAGMGRFDNVQEARILKTLYFFKHRALFLSQLKKEIEASIKRAKKLGLTPCFRLNLTSDIRWELFDIPQSFPDSQFYDYTKITNRRNIPKNYHLTYSRKETDSEDGLKEMLNHMNVAVVFSAKKGLLPNEYLGFPVLDGDTNDLRFLDPVNTVIGLKAKGKAKQDTTSGFVVFP